MSQDSEATAASSRGRWKGDIAALAAQLLPFAKSKSFVVYDENPLVMKAKVDVKQLKDVAPLAAALKANLGSISFTKSDIIGALKIVYEERNSDWKMKDCDKADWETTICRRLLNALHIMVVNETRPKPPAWVFELLPWTRSGEAPPPAPREAALPAEYYYGWKQDLMLPFRRPCGGTEADDELGYPPRPSEDMGDMEFIVASFKDGT
jgi:hypothetical protein